jgi:hypothetical protein
MQQWQKCLPDNNKDGANSMAEISILPISDSVGAMWQLFLASVFFVVLS